MSQSDTREKPASAPVDEPVQSRPEGDGSTPPKAESGEAPEGPEAEVARLRERLLRTAADFDNYRKRTRRDIADAERHVQENLLLRLLPTFDNLERAATHAGTGQDVKALAEGIAMVLRQFQDALTSLGIERVSAEGQPFDPAAHEAVQHVETDQQPPGTVAKELQAGYRWQGRLLRPAMVVVAKGPAAGDKAAS